MKKLIRFRLFLLVLVGIIGNAEADSDVFFVDRMMISKSIKKNALKLSVPKSRDWIFTNEDKIIFYYANIGVINPTKKEYEVKFVCIDSKGNIVIDGASKMNISELSKYQLEKNTIRGDKIIIFSLNPKNGAMVKGQFIPLEKDNDYYVKLYVEKELIGVTEFNYEITI